MAVDYDDLAAEFALRDYRWKIGGELICPSAKDIEETLDRMKSMLYAQPTATQVGSGRLVLQRTGEDTFDIYLQIGELT